VAAGAVVAVRARPAGAKAGVSDGFVLQMLTSAPDAVCLDGSPSGFYLRNGTVSSWVRDAAVHTSHAQWHSLLVFA